MTRSSPSISLEGGMDGEELEKLMRIATIIAAAAVAAIASIIYIRHLSKIGCRDRYILPTFLNHGVVPFWIEMSYGFVLGVSMVVLNNVLPLWAAFAVFLAAVVPSAELTRHRHNRRVANPTTPAAGKDTP
ncbi:hypothetical protein [Streptomyces xanthophaeus]|uniref:hypothetical protein n=1 Tax=Streptomyces xanthophaeus TaxID=67385 RepID=UPI0026491C0E|nr:hypothetical protein [Streptomyces xanthophaeus]WKD30629.1 hypothetical protein KO717_00670 [Streptomyces xanthophaeus]